MEGALPARASFVETARTMGRSLRRCALVARVTGPSAMPQASFASVLPVQGAMTRQSSSFLGPIGSVCAMVWRISWPQIA